MTDAEKELIRKYPDSYEFMLTLLWTAKEALSKILKTGLMTSFKILEIDKIEHKDGYWLSYYKSFGQYKVISFQTGSLYLFHYLSIKNRVNFQSGFDSGQF